MSKPPEGWSERTREIVRELLDFTRVRRAWKTTLRRDPDAFWLDFLAPIARGGPVVPVGDRRHDMAA